MQPRMHVYARQHGRVIITAQSLLRADGNLTSRGARIFAGFVVRSFRSGSRGLVSSVRARTVCFFYTFNILAEACNNI